MSTHKIIHGKSEIELKQFEDNSIDSCVTDPPYGLEFMGKDWDRFNDLSGDKTENGYFSHGMRLPNFYDLKNTDLHAFQQFTYQWAIELYRVLKPGAHILVFGGTRTYHRMVCAIEDSGFEVRDMINWVYGSGFPKSLDISKSMDKMNGKEREVIDIKKDDQPANTHTYGGFPEQDIGNNRRDTKITVPTSKEAIQWNGWGTGMKPAHESILLARKPISERNIAANVLKWGVGGLNIDECRIGMEERFNSPATARKGTFNCSPESGISYIGKTIQGRFPANLILECCCEDEELVEGKEIKNTGSFGKTAIFGQGDRQAGTKKEERIEKVIVHINPNCVCRMLDEQSGELKTGGGNKANHKPLTRKSQVIETRNIGEIWNINQGGASRFYYQAKASQKERWFYCTICKRAYPMKERDKHIHNAPDKTKYQYLEFHPTQKPLQLIQYLIRLITPPDGTVIDPFLGSGTGLIAAEREGFNAIGIDSNLEYCLISNQRLKNEIEQEQTKLIKEQSTIQRIDF